MLKIINVLCNVDATINNKGFRGIGGNPDANIEDLTKFQKCGSVLNDSSLEQDFEQDRGLLRGRLLGHSLVVALAAERLVGVLLAENHEFGAVREPV